MKRLPASPLSADRFLRATVLVGALTLATTVGWSCGRRRAEPEVSRLRPAMALLYGADLRGRFDGTGSGGGTRGGLARRATLADEARLEADAVIQVDAGDFLPAPGDAAGMATPLGKPRAPLILAAYRRMGVDAVLPGARELALGAEGLLTLVADSKVPMIAANVVALGSGGPHRLESDRLIAAAGHQIGVFGVVDLSGESQANLPRWGFTLGDAATAARAAAVSLRARGAQFLVALIYADRGAARARGILTAAGLWGGTADVDVLVVGGEPARAAQSLSLGRDALVSRPALVEAGDEGATFGRLNVYWLASGGAPTMANRVLPVTGAIREQWGVSLIERAATIQVVEGRLANDPPPGASREERLANFENWKFGGTESCVACHETEGAQWSTTDHAHALETLKGKGHDRDSRCVGCHMTGFLAPGGTRFLATATAYFPNVGCESCHGPSVEHVRSVDKRRGTSRKVDPIVCLGCHTPDQNLGPFDFATAIKDVLGPGHGFHDRSKDAPPAHGPSG
jgi:hypothetical protein